jgi:hypothetical protein
MDAPVGVAGRVYWAQLGLATWEGAAGVNPHAVQYNSRGHAVIRLLSGGLFCQLYGLQSL